MGVPSLQIGEQHENVNRFEEKKALNIGKKMSINEKEWITGRKKKRNAREELKAIHHVRGSRSPLPLLNHT